MGSGQRRAGAFLRLMRLRLDGVENQDVHSEILSRVSPSVLGGSILCMQHKFSFISVVLNPRVPELGA